MNYEYMVTYNYILKNIYLRGGYMFSMKKLIISIVSSVLIILVLMLGINKIAVKNVTLELSSIHKNLNQLNNNYSEFDFNVRVLNNILNQEANFYLLPKDRQLNLLNAYKKTYTQSLININNLVDNAYYIGLSLDNLQKLPSILYLKKESSIIDSFNLVNKYIDSINKDFTNSYLENYFDSNSSEVLITKASLTKSQLAFEISELKNNSLDLTNAFEQLNSDLISNYTRTINLLIFILIFTISMLTLLLIRLIRYDIKILLKSLEKLELHDYNMWKPHKHHFFFKEELLTLNIIDNIFKEQSFIKETKDIVSRGYMMDEILEELFLHLKDTFDIDRLGIAFVDYKNKQFIAEYGISTQDKILLGPGFFANFEETSLTNILHTRKAFITSDLELALEKKPNSPSLNLLQKEGIKSNMVLPLTKDDNVFAILFFSSNTKNKFSQTDLSLASKVVYDLGAVLDISYLTKIVFSEITGTLAELVDKKDNDTGGHIVRMVNYSKIIAAGLINHPNDYYRVDKYFVSEIERNASVHDIGKVGIPDNILKKPGKLTSEEWEVMKTHPSIGGGIFTNLKDNLQGFNKNYYKIAEEITLYHHEKWDGSGYPEGLTAEEIPLSARIVAIADVFDALTAKRVYKDAFEFDKAVEIIKDSAGSHFDPILVDVFVSELENIRKVYEKYKE